MPEALVIPPAAALPFEVVPAAAPLPVAAPLESLGNLIVENLARHESLSARVRLDIVDTLENAIRAGWYLSDAQTYLSSDAGFVAWVERNLPITYHWANQLRRLSRHFARDLTDCQLRAKLNIYPEGLSSVPTGIHLREQVIATGASSIRQLLKLTGVVKPETREAGASGSKKGAHPRGLKATLDDLKLHVRTLEDLKRALNATASALVQVDPATLSLDEATEMLNWLSPFAEFHRALLVKIL